MEMSTAMMPMTTRSSTSVKPALLRPPRLLLFPICTSKCATADRQDVFEGNTNVRSSHPQVPAAPYDLDRDRSLRRWQRGQKHVDRPPRTIRLIGVLHRRHGSPPRAYTRCRRWTAPLP